ncbi:MAG: (2Fe-2S)-binding protein [Vicinamibacterales bacterium]
MSIISLSVNRKQVEMDLDPETPLLWALRDHLNLVGAKFGCGGGFCGACTVHVDGVAARSCTLPIKEAGGKQITTIEGLSPDGTHHVQRAWEAIDVPQCGYCQAGQIMTAVALLVRTPDPTDAQIDAAMNGNLCRCGTYKRIHEAVRRAAEMSSRPFDFAVGSPSAGGGE